MHRALQRGMFTYPFHRVLVATDFSGCADSALELGARLAHDHGAELLVLHVVEVRGLGLDVRIHPKTHPEGITVDAYTRELAERQLAQRLEHLPVMVRRRAEVVHGAAGPTILEFAQREHADLIVMGTRGRSGLAHLFAGSVAERVVRHSVVPVVTVREPTCRQPPVDPDLGDELEG